MKITPMSDENLKAYCDLDRAFGNEKIFLASPEEIEGGLRALCKASTANNRIQHRDIIRGITLNTLMLRHLTTEMEQRSNLLQRWFMILACIGAIAAIAQIIW